MSAIFFDSAAVRNISRNVFGLGVRDLDAEDLAEIAFTNRLAEIEANEALMARHEARVKAEIASKVATAKTPTAADHAWELGYQLGRDGVEAGASAHYTVAERSAFEAGHADGLAAFEADERDQIEAMIAAWEADNHSYDPEAHELAEARMVA